MIRSTDETQVDGAVAQLCATAVAAGRAVSLTPPPSLDRSTLAAAFAATDHSPKTRLMTTPCSSSICRTLGRAVQRVRPRRTSLGAANETTAPEDAPSLSSGTAKSTAVAEQAAREARYENDDGVFEPHDTVVNVIDDDAVPATLAAFYRALPIGLALTQTDGREYRRLPPRRVAPWARNSQYHSFRAHPSSESETTDVRRDDTGRLTFATNEFAALLDRTLTNSSAHPSKRWSQLRTARH